MNKLKGLWSCAWFYHWAPLLRSEGLQCSRAAIWIRFNLVTLFMCHLYSRQSIAFSWNHLAHQVMWLLLQTLVYGGLGKCRLWGRPEVLEGGWFVTQNIKNWEIRGLLLKIRIFNYFTEFPTFFLKIGRPGNTEFTVPCSNTWLVLTHSCCYWWPQLPSAFYV